MYREPHTTVDTDRQNTLFSVLTNKSRLGIIFDKFSEFLKYFGTGNLRKKIEGGCYAFTLVAFLLLLYFDFIIYNEKVLSQNLQDAISFITLWTVVTVFITIFCIVTIRVIFTKVLR